MNDRRTTPSRTAPYRLLVALRLLRARKINLISVIGVMLGVASIIVVLAVMDGFQRDLRSMIRGTLSDLICEVDPAMVDSYGVLKEVVGDIDGVAAVTLQKQTFGAIPSSGTKGADGGRQNYLPMRVVGILPEEEAQVSDLLTDYLEEAPGQPADPFRIETPDLVMEETPRVVVSAWTASHLGHGIPLEIGERFTLVSFEEVEENGQARYVTQSREVVISRIYDSKNSEYDRFHLYVDLRGSGQVFFPTNQGVITELRIKLDDYNRADEVRKELLRVLAPMPESQVKTWEQRQQNLLLAVNNEKAILAFVLFFIVLVACFTIFATLTMTVVEKTRDIGVLRALGATPGGIMSIFMLNGTLVGVFGSALGYGVGLLVANNVNPIRTFLKSSFGWEIFPPNIYLFDDIPTYIDHPAVLAYAVAAMVSALVFAIIPAARAARLRPVEALRYE